MDFSVSDFRTSMPEFTDTERYPDSLISTWAAVAVALVNCKRWKSQTQLGVNLYVAHEITLEAQSISTSKIGGSPGGQNGVVSSKTVGSVTQAYDTTSVAEKDAGWWNLTSYGKQFFRLAQIYGSGVIQL